jgi:secondary thiamine-phosphate synthase enzyme
MLAVHTGNIRFSTQGEIEVRDITHEVSNIIKESGLSSGIACVFVPGATGAITTIEYEDGLEYDIKSAFKRLVPKDLEYRHELRWHDGNGHSHIRASILGPSISIPFKDRNIILGTWQQIIFVEFDNKPHQRNLVVQVVGE